MPAEAVGQAAAPHHPARLRELAVVLMRGGTSKGVFCRLADLPPAGADRDAFLLSLMGSPDPMQLDGLGGTYSSPSKVMAGGAGPRPRGGGGEPLAPGRG